MYRIGFEIAECGITLQSSKKLHRSAEFKEFETTVQDGILCTCTACDRIEIPEGTCCLEETEYKIIKKKDGTLVRIFKDLLDAKRPYAVSFIQQDTKERQIQYLKEKESYLDSIANSFFHIGFEEILMEKEKMILHASFITTEMGGILFTGVSGIGKSTQAALWNQYEKARIINGDRPILGRKEGQWYAYGSPYAGSSGYFVNDKEKIHAIVLLKKGESNRIQKIRKAEAFRKLYSGITINTWNPDYVEKTVALIEQLIQEVPILEYTCTKEKTAVDELKQYLLTEVKNI